MRRLSSSVLLLVLLAVLPLAAHAQGGIPPLTETFSAADESFSFKYPAEWEIDPEGGLPGVTFSVPIASSGEPNDAGIAIESSGMSVIFTLQTFTADTNVLDEAQAQVEILAGGEDSPFEASEPLEFTISGIQAVQIDALSDFFPSRYIFMQAASDTVVMVWIIGTTDQIEAATPIVIQMLVTLRLSGDTTPIEQPTVDQGEPLTESYTREVNQISFKYPLGWTVEEQDTYSLLTAPNGVTVGISADPFTGSPADMKRFMSSQAEEYGVSLSDAIPDMVPGEVKTFTLNERFAVRIDITDGSNYAVYMGVRVSDDKIGRVTIVGDPDGVQELVATAEAITASIKMLDTVGESNPPAVTTGEIGDMTLFEATDANVTFEYPNDWEQFSVGNIIFLSNSEALLFEDTNRDIQSGEVLAIIFASREELLTMNNDMVLNADATPAEIVPAFADIMGLQRDLTEEELTINGHVAILDTGNDGDLDGAILAVELPNGDVATFLVMMPLGEYEQFEPLLMHMAQTLQVAK